MIWAISLLTMDLSAHSLIAKFNFNGITGFYSFKEAVKRSPRLQCCHTPIKYYLTLYLNKFAENQLSPDSISFSLLTTVHPNLMQQTWVRPSSYDSACPWLDHLVSGLVHKTF